MMIMNIRLNVIIIVWLFNMISFIIIVYRK